MTVTTIPWIVVLAFGAIFIFAAVREILHRRKHGPPENPRDVFEFDEDAPSYEEPEELPDETADDTADTPDETDADDTAPRKTRPDGPPHCDPDAANDDDVGTTTPDKGETPR